MGKTYKEDRTGKYAKQRAARDKKKSKHSNKPRSTATNDGDGDGVEL